jgi:hypothetical protein
MASPQEALTSFLRPPGPYNQKPKQVNSFRISNQQDRYTLPLQKQVKLNSGYQELKRTGLLDPILEAATNLMEKDRSVTLAMGYFFKKDIRIPGKGIPVSEIPVLELAAETCISKRNPITSEDGLGSWVHGGEVGIKSIDSHLWKSKRARVFRIGECWNIAYPNKNDQLLPFEYSVDCFEGWHFTVVPHDKLDRLPNLLNKALSKSQYITDSRNGVDCHNLKGLPSGGDFFGITLPLEQKV